MVTTGAAVSPDIATPSIFLLSLWSC